MKRIKYVKVGDQTNQVVYHSSSVFPTTKGSVVVKLLGEDTFQLVNSETQELIQAGTSKSGNYVVLRRKAKNALLALMEANPFEKETRNKKPTV